MKLWLISQDENDNCDTYDSAIVAAPTAEYARTIHPEGPKAKWGERYSSWCKSPVTVTAKEIGEAIEGTKAGAIILASFHAG